MGEPSYCNQLILYSISGNKRNSQFQLLLSIIAAWLSSHQSWWKMETDRMIHRREKTKTWRREKWEADQNQVPTLPQNVDFVCYHSIDTCSSHWVHQVHGVYIHYLELISLLSRDTTVCRNVPLRLHASAHAQTRSASLCDSSSTTLVIFLEWKAQNSVW